MNASNKGHTWLLAIALASLAASVAYARPPMADPFAGWDRLGTTRLRADVDRGSITVGTSDHSYRRLAFRLARGSVILDDVVVSYAGGETYAVDPEIDLTPERPRYEIVLPGEAGHVVTRVDFEYTPNREAPDAAIELFGR